jgi:G3E family GTPase
LQKTPVTIVTGFLGAGKTTLVNHLLANTPERRIGVLVNDFGEVNIDAKLIVGTAGDVISLQNGCICCSMKGELTQAVLRVLEHPSRPEHLLVEASGVSSPGPLADTFLQLQKSGVLRLDGVVAVVDAERFPFDDLKGQALARDQVLASDLVVLNKADLVAEERLIAMEAAIRQRLPKARLIRAVKAAVPSEVLLGLAAEREAPLLRRAHTEDHGFESLSFSAKAPIPFKALMSTINELPGTVVRIKGLIEVVERPGDRLVLHGVGKRVQVETIGAAQGSSQLVFIANREGFDRAALISALLPLGLEI